MHKAKSEKTSHIYRWDSGGGRGCVLSADGQIQNFARLNFCPRFNFGFLQFTNNKAVFIGACRLCGIDVFSWRNNDGGIQFDRYYFNDKSYSCRNSLNALYDTGNSLVDGDKPVIVLSKRCGEKYISKSEREIVVKTVGGLSTLKLLDGESIKFKQKGEVRFSVAVSKENYVGYDVVLHSTFC